MPNLSLLMKLSATKILCVVLPMAVLLISSHVPAQEQSQSDQVPDVKEEFTVECRIWQILYLWRQNCPAVWRSLKKGLRIYGMFLQSKGIPESRPV